MSVCDWFSKMFIGGDNYKPHKAQLASTEDSIIFCRTEFYEQYKDECAKPDTVESLLNQFIALGHEKPVVVIKGESFVSGYGEYLLTIEGLPIATTSTIAKAEEWAIWKLKLIYDTITIETIEITY